jgi:hypothetical protein
MKTRKTKTEGPLLEALTHRLSQCPREFLYAPRIGNRGEINVAAVVSDLLIDMASQVRPADTFRVFREVTQKDANWLQMVLVTCWLIHDPWFLGHPELVESVLELLRVKLKRLSAVVTAEQCVLEPDRREELARFCLNELGLYPEGETKVQAIDRLSALDSAERVRVMREVQRAEAHARKVREAMKKKKAREAAAKVMRE